MLVLLFRVMHIVAARFSNSDKPLVTCYGLDLICV